MLGQDRYTICPFFFLLREKGCDAIMCERSMLRQHGSGRGLGEADFGLGLAAEQNLVEGSDCGRGTKSGAEPVDNVLGR